MEPDDLRRKLEEARQRRLSREGCKDAPQDKIASAEDADIAQETTAPYRSIIDIQNDPVVWQTLISAYPELYVEKLPPLDSLVVEFLRRHDVTIKPVSSNTSPSRATNALMGAMGPLAIGMNMAITQQQKGAALQEWTSWKQWALSHPDWPAFKDSVEQKYMRACESQQRRFDEPEIQAFIASAYERVKVKKAKDNLNLVIITAAVLLVLVVIRVIVWIVSLIG